MVQGDDDTGSEDEDDTESEGEIDYHKILEQLLSHDRSLDSDAFDEDDLDALWGNDAAGGKKGGNKRTKGAKKTLPAAKVMHKKGTAAPAHTKEGVATRGSSGSRSAAGARTEGARSSAGAGSRSAAAHNPRTSRSSDPSLTARSAASPAGASRSKTMGDSSALDGFRSSLNQTAGKKDRSSTGYGNAIGQRRAPSKRGPYVPKNNTDFDTLPDDLGRNSLSQRGDSSARWASSGSSSRPALPSRPGRAAPGARTQGSNHNPEMRREKTGGGARRAMASREPNALTDQFYASRAPTGGGRSFARSPLGRQKAAQEEALTKELAKELSRNSRAPGSGPFGKKARADSKFARSSRRAVGRGPANRGVRQEVDVYESEQYAPQKREKMDSRGNRAQFQKAKPGVKTSAPPTFGKPGTKPEAKKPRKTSPDSGKKPGPKGF
jgi:hypothetical protein